MLSVNVVQKYNMQSSGFISRMNKYLKERFHLGQFVPLSLILAGVLSVGTQIYLKQTASLSLVLISALALFIFLLRLRLFDEFKDYEHDLKHYSHRPVPRGLVSKRELGLVLIPLIILEFVTAFISGLNGLFLFVAAFIYSLLMFKEFFVTRWIKNHFTTYIFSHEILLFPLFFYLCAINGFSITSINNHFFWYLVTYAGCSMFLLEITRKVRSKDSEIASKDTYTAQYGIMGASILLLIVSFVMIVSLWKVIISINLNYSPVLISLFFFGFFCWRLYNFNKRPVIEVSKKVFLFYIFCFCFLCSNDICFNK